MIRKISHIRILLFKPHTSQLVLETLAWYQHVSGISYPVLEQHPFTMDHINSFWLDDLVRLTKKYKVELKLRKKIITQRQRHNDRHLLDDILTHTSSLLSRKKLLACRLYFQITLLSDITNIKGSALLPNILIDTRNTNTHHTYSWPLQKNPNNHSWKLWNRTLRSIYYCETSSLQLKKKIYPKRWIPNRIVVHRYQYSPTANEVFEYKHPAFYRSFVKEQSTTSLILIPTTTELCDDIPLDAYPIILCPENSFKVYNQHGSIFANPAQLQDFSNYIQSIPEWIHLLIWHYTVQPSSDSLRYHIINQTQLLISTDSSRTHNKSGGSGMIALTDGTKLILGHNPEFGRHVDINSYHSENYASLSSFTFLECFCDYF